MGFRGELLLDSPAPQPDSPSRRRLLIGTAATAGVLLAAGIAQEITSHQEAYETIRFSPDEYGLNLNYRNFNQYHLNSREILPKLLAFPGNHVRIPVYLDMVFANGEIPDFRRSDAYLDASIAAGKKLHLVFGTKTTAGDEWNLSPTYKKAFPFKDMTVIGATDEERDILRYEVGEVAKHYLTNENYVPHIASIHRTNEAGSENLIVTNKVIDKEWYIEEHYLVKKYNEHGIPVVQNIPLDTPENIPFVLPYCDIAGINIYPQSWYATFGRIGDAIAQARFWNTTNDAFELARNMGKRVIVPEKQIAQWTHPPYPFKEERMERSFREVRKHDPDITFIWDIEQLYATGKTERIQYLHDLAA